MSEGLIRLAWTVAPSGYEIMTRDDLCHGRPLSVRAPNGQVYTWHWREVGVGLDLTKYRDSDEFIVPLIDPCRRSGCTHTEYQVGLRERGVFRELINSERQPGHTGVLAFVNRWGLLTRQSVTPLESFVRARNIMVRAFASITKAHGHRSEGVAHLLKETSRSLSSMFFPRTALGVLGPLQARFDTRKRALYFQAETLFQFCALELLYAYDAAIDVTACDACGTVLPLHKSGRRKKYCNDACKMANYRAKNGDALNRVRRQRRAKRRVVAK
jgi:hypothetical protein